MYPVPDRYVAQSAFNHLENFGGAIGNFEVVVPEGTKLTHYYHDNTSANSVWQRGATVRA